MSNRWRRNAYIHPTLDRAAFRRGSLDLPSPALGPQDRVILEWRGRTAFAAGSSLEISGTGWTGPVQAFLGLVAETRYFLADLSDLGEEAAFQWLTRQTAGAEWAELRLFASNLDGPTAALLAYGRGLAHWQRRHRFCGACGSGTVLIKGGHVTRCSNPSCGLEHFPRTDPAVIMLVKHGDRALLGRHPKWVKGRYSTLAGFVEPGESLEQAVIREVAEESGIHIADVQYHSSQPWPFPSSIMIGYVAEASSTDITLDPEELEDARWFTRAEVGEFAAKGYSLSPADSIARRLIDDWLAGDI
jgi:NAD+ diphosphatase